MITIKTGSYTPYEVKVLEAFLSDSLSRSTHLNADCNLDCNSCPIRHLCGDLVRARDYMKRLNENNKKEGNL